MKVFIGTSQPFDIVRHVIENSIRENTAVDVDINFISPELLNVRPSGCTGFTNLRYAVPQLCDYQGYAIYLDIDMIVLGDLSELYAYRLRDRWVRMHDGSSEVSVIDCAAHRHLPRLNELHNFNKWQLHGMVRAANNIPPEWNVKDTVQDDMKLLHFTDLKCQPWFYKHPCAEAVAIYEQYA